MQPSAPNRSHLRARILEKLAASPPETMPRPYLTALNVFFELSLEYDSLRDFKTLCVLVPHVCLNTPASLYLRGPKGVMKLRRTTNPGGHSITFPEPQCPERSFLIRQDDACAVPVCEIGTERLLGVLCLHKLLDSQEEAFFLEFAHRLAQIMAIKQTAVSNRQRLTFINTLVRDIGHNVIVPNMQFKLLFLQMERHLALLGKKLDALAPIRGDSPDREVRLELKSLVRELHGQQEAISRRFQQASLFLESLLRRSHFEKGSYDLLIKTCKFKSQVFEPQIERFRPLLRAQGIVSEIDPDVRIDEDILLEADLGLISQVFANLLANAVKYTRAVTLTKGEGGKLMRYGWQRLEDAFGSGAPGFRLYVATTGPEIPAPDQPRLFEPDFRVNPEAGVEGSGHGLFFVKQIVELHQGRVGYSYEPPMNVFSIILPSPSNPHGAREASSCPNPS